MPAICGRARPSLPDGAGVGQGVGATGAEEVRQADGLPEEPVEPTGADQQPCGADQPDVPVAGEGALQVASSQDAGAVRGVDAGRDLEGPHQHSSKGDRSLKADRAGQDRRCEKETTLRGVKSRWCSARSVRISCGWRTETTHAPILKSKPC